MKLCIPDHPFCISVLLLNQDLVIISARRSNNFQKTLLIGLLDILSRKLKSDLEFTFQFFTFSARPTPFLFVNSTGKSQCRKPVCNGRIIIEEQLVKTFLMFKMMQK